MPFQLFLIDPDSQNFIYRRIFQYFYQFIFFLMTQTMIDFQAIADWQSNKFYSTCSKLHHHCHYYIRLYQKSKDYIDMMNQRKHRVPLHGMSNIKHAGTDFKFKCSNMHQTDAHYIKQANISKALNKKHQNLKHRKNYSIQLLQSANATTTQQKNRNKTIDIHECSSSPPKENKTLQKIRHAYKTKSNIWRIAKAWNFSSKGFITMGQFQDKICKLMGSQLDKESYEGICSSFSQFCNCDGEIDINRFLGLVYGDQGSFAYQPKLFQIQDKNDVRNQKIGNLIDKLDIYESALKQKKDQSIIADNPLKARNSETLAICKSKSLKTAERSQKFLNLQFNKDHFNRLTQNSFKKYKQSVKQNNFHPQNVQNQNQAKSRFGATINRGISQILCSSTEKGLNKIEYHNLMRDFSSAQKNEKKIKMYKKIEKIKEFQNIQKQNIEKVQKKEQDRDNGRLQRKRLDRQAYQYASFLKNQWL